MDIDTPPRPTPTPEEETNHDSLATPSASADNASKYPNMKLAQDIHTATMLSTKALEAEDVSAVGASPDLLSAIEKTIGDDIENPTLYRSCLQNKLSSFIGAKSEEQLKAMEEKNKKSLAELEQKVEVAKENAGDMEVLDARFAVARFCAKSFNKEEALEAYEKVLNLPKLSSGKTIDALMEAARVASFHGDTKKNKEMIEKAVKLAADGGDWDRRNRLKVYSALNKLLARDVKTAASLLIDCIATFSCNELCSYTDFIMYTVISNLLHLPRTALKEKIIDGPEIISVVNEVPTVSELANTLYDCDYAGYLRAVVAIRPILVADRFLRPHAGYIVRELHVLGYKQFLDSYKSVTLESMATSFGVGAQFLDLQLSRFIAAGRLTAKIDKFGGVVETNRPDLKNAQYRDMIQKGDLLLNRVQKLARVVDL